MKTKIQIDLVITRHPSLVQYLIELGLADESTPVVEHASASDVRRKHVVGILPHHLSSLAASITEIPMRTTTADREAMQRGDLTLERLREVAGSPVTYTVQQVGSAQRPGLAWARAYDYAEGYGRAHVGPVGQWRGLDVFVIEDDTQSLAAEVLDQRGVWRPRGTETWLDGLGCLVDDVMPAQSWGYRLRPADALEQANGATHMETLSSMPRPLIWQRWETLAEATEAAARARLPVDLQVLRGDTHGAKALVLATIPGTPEG